jgi:hypothetical protein
MKISKKYIILNSVIILLTSLFLIFLLVFKHNDPNLPDWILTIGYLFFAASILSFIWNLKSVQITQNGIQINRVVFPNIIIDKDNIIEIEESRFKYRGEHNSQTVYNGYYLTVSSNKKKYKTSSLNEPNYYELRKALKETYGQLVKLDKDYKGDSMNWFYIIIMLLPAGYLFVEIIKRIK